jgi:hypothetical protein
VYEVPGLNPETEIGEVNPVAVTVSVPFETKYWVIATPPVFAGAVNATETVVEVILEILIAVGESGAVA